MTILIATALAAVQVAPAAPPAPPPVVSLPVVLRERSPGVPLAPQPQLLRWSMSPVLCREGGGGTPGLRAQPVLTTSEPQRALAWLLPNQPRTVAFDFRIDASGRPLSIVRATSAYVADAQDLAPALAATRFAPEAERGGCTVTFTASGTTVAAAPIADVMAYSVFPTMPPGKPVWDRLRAASGTCADPAPAVLLRAYPAFKTLPNQPGYPTWSMVGYDLDAAGRPRNLRTVAGSGTPALDRAARDAVARSRFEKGARTGCLYPYYKTATILAAPPAPEEASARPADATCPAQRDWVRPPVLTYPTAWQRRSIEGWAMVVYDVAPWGQTGNIRVLAAEPSAEFGEAATAMIRNATVKPAGVGYTGCVDRVRYVIRKPGAPAPAAEAEPVPPPPF